ncbi:MAG: hypothetical protein US67_C0071G0004 [Candidatus Woesebacteria bacterium GW2011_GWD1_38_10]|uniref:Uncharacterized protein n=1 Tax=Candidatus Woesebacteria bacterium GW2011_GWD1_38_10 TaxID=1618592 RepID=A0A0G0HU81_9BACT|nr:MAG: hypothetical protein US67_C0071G0004 [Candidatus Woesebacteria bacterium GW2011_GWD1_38_10]
MYKVAIIKTMIRNNFGFTLIETLVTLALTSVAVMTITVIIFNSLQANNKINYLEKVDRNGSAVLEEIKKNLYKADATTIICGGGQSTVTFTNKYDGVTTTLRCIEGITGKIASISGVGTTVSLTSSDVGVSGCSGFVASCITGSASPTLEFNFALSAGSTDPGSKNYAKKFFRTKVVIRR